MEHTFCGSYFEGRIENCNFLPQELKIQAEFVRLDRDNEDNPGNVLNGKILSSFGKTNVLQFVFHPPQKWSLPRSNEQHCNQSYSIRVDLFLLGELNAPKNCAKLLSSVTSPSFRVLRYCSHPERYSQKTPPNVSKPRMGLIRKTKPNYSITQRLLKKGNWHSSFFHLPFKLPQLSTKELINYGFILEHKLALEIKEPKSFLFSPILEITDMIEKTHGDNNGSDSF